MIQWLLRASGLHERSCEHQRANTRIGLAKVVAAVSAIEAEWAANREPTPARIRALDRAKGSLCADMVGPLTVDELEREVIWPALAATHAEEGTRLAVAHTIECFRRDLAKQ
jgi:hypothetical protein